MGFFSRFFETRDANDATGSSDDGTGGSGSGNVANEPITEDNPDPLLSSITSSASINSSTALYIPAVASCINKIADTVASLDIKLFRKVGDSIEEVVDDVRTKLLNSDTGDSFDGFNLKRRMIFDMYLKQGGYAYVKKSGNQVVGIFYVDANNISFNDGTDPILKDYTIRVNGSAEGSVFEGFQFIKLLRNSSNGYNSTSIISENAGILETAYNTQLFEKNCVTTGGNKKGFIKSEVRLSSDAMTSLKNAFRNLYSNNTENVVVLNDGLDFKESSNNSVELQINENKKTNNDDICKIFCVPPSIINGGCSDSDKKQFVEGCILPLVTKFQKAINSVLLLEDEKDSLFFEFDIDDLLKADIDKRYLAYDIAIKSGFMQLDEVRRLENLPELGIKFIKLGLQDVLYFSDEDKIYTPNMNASFFINDNKNSDNSGLNNDVNNNSNLGGYVGGSVGSSVDGSVNDS